jgi:uncharacterized caspase-like protein
MGAAASTDAGDERPQRRVALCIALSDAYGKGTVGGASLRDCHAVADTLTHLGGYSVRMVTEPRDGADSVKEALAATANDVQPGDHALVYFSGHAAAFAGTNWLVCAGASAGTARVCA